MSKREKGIILNGIDYKENHKISYILTSDGIKSVLFPRAKRIKEGITNDTQSLTLIEFDYNDKNSLLKGLNVNAIDSYFDIKNDIKKYAVASYALEVIYRFVNPDINPNMLYNLVLEFLNQLRKRTDVKVLLLQFRIKILYFLGIQPNFKECIHCRTKENLVGLSINFGSMECIHHESRDNIGMTATNIIKLLYLDKSFEMEIADEEAFKYLSSIVDEYFTLHQPNDVKSKKMLMDLKCY